MQGSGFLAMLTVAFIVLKLLNKITWSWWYVLMPTWLPASIAIIIFIIAIIRMRPHVRLWK